MHRIFIDGSVGTTGLRLYERLSTQEDIVLLTLNEAERKNPTKRKELLHEADISFLCLPDDAAREAVALCENSSARLIDTSCAHRTASGWAYGFAELAAGQRERIAKSNRVSVPGCHASGYIALTAPLVNAGVLDGEALISCTSITGYSGGGKSLIAQYQDEGREKSFKCPRPYALGQAHKHLKEMAAYSGISTPPVFMPTLGDFYSGMLVLIPLHNNQLKKRSSIAELRELYNAHYEGSKVVKVVREVEDNPTLSADKLAGRDDMELLIAGNDERFCLIARYDNLGKGASGAALQSMNIMLNRPQETGLVLK
ncbi:N-acetyl-gamma-glutamyl-phosphate reductase [Eubacteriales bacterium OttesenSCG-928-K08]|nr:N-acetyl-gamma-glutamyl-phosphate reductase [Eubacteriales bacterium OttesenSCG-928-K08]